MTALPPAHWSGDVVLADGEPAFVRPIRPEDAPALEAFHARLSADTIYFRFFSPHPRLSPDELHRFTHVDHHDRVAFVLEVHGELAAVGRYERSPRSEAAEVAFVVADAHQGRGIGTLLLERLAAAARERGLVRFVADVLPQNRAMLRVFHDAGFETTTRFEDGMARVAFPLATTPESLRVMAEREWRAIARSVRSLLTPRGVGIVSEGAGCDAVASALQAALAAAGSDPLPVAWSRLGEGDPREAGHAASRARAGRTQATPRRDAQPLDLWLLAVPAGHEEAALTLACQGGAHAAVLLASGPACGAVPDPTCDRALAALARRHGVRLLGPESLGLARPASGLRAVVAGPPPKPGPLALFMESPALGRDALQLAHERGVGLSTFVSAGRKADVSASDVLRFWERDRETRVVALELRTLGNPRRAPAVARRVSRRKPVLVWLPDPALPLPEGLFDALVSYTGVLPCRSLEDVFDVAEAFLWPRRVRAPRSDVVRRIARWRRWRRRPPERFLRAEGMDTAAIRARVDEALAEAPGGRELDAGATAALLRHYGVSTVEAVGDPSGDAQRTARPASAAAVLHVRQDVHFGPWLSLEPAHGAVRRCVLPLTARSLRSLLEALPASARAAGRCAALALAALAQDVPELCALALEIPARRNARLRLRTPARLAPWTLGVLGVDPERG